MRFATRHPSPGSNLAEGISSNRLPSLPHHICEIASTDPAVWMQPPQPPPRPAAPATEPTAAAAPGNAIVLAFSDASLRRIGSLSPGSWNRDALCEEPSSSSLRKHQTRSCFTIDVLIATAAFLVVAALVVAIVPTCTLLGCGMPKPQDDQVSFRPTGAPGSHPPSSVLFDALLQLRCQALGSTATSAACPVRCASFTGSDVSSPQHQRPLSRLAAAMQAAFGELGAPGLNVTVHRATCSELVASSVTTSPPPGTLARPIGRSRLAIAQDGSALELTLGFKVLLPEGSGPEVVAAVRDVATTGVGDGGAASVAVFERTLAEALQVDAGSPVEVKILRFVVVSDDGAPPPVPMVPPPLRLPAPQPSPAAWLPPPPPDSRQPGDYMRLPPSTPLQQPLPPSPSPPVPVPLSPLHPVPLPPSTPPPTLSLSPPYLPWPSLPPLYPPPPLPSLPAPLPLVPEPSASRPPQIYYGSPPPPLADGDLPPPTQLSPQLPSPQVPAMEMQPAPPSPDPPTAPVSTVPSPPGVMPPLAPSAEPGPPPPPQPPVTPLQSPPQDTITPSPLLPGMPGPISSPLPASSAPSLLPPPTAPTVQQPAFPALPRPPASQPHPLAPQPTSPLPLPPGFQRLEPPSPFLSTTSSPPLPTQENPEPLSRPISPNQPTSAVEPTQPALSPSTYASFSSLRLQANETVPVPTRPPFAPMMPFPEQSGSPGQLDDQSHIK
ncbi:hypothetical protein Vretifemale_14630 [Volvox reticuliferus]|uniref:Uncharacterized protein n=2 Tax=Volvox reticuliferus TaxID=1737510 RepID=A0A8J4CQ38_9CHLO|nr:hypothetical protein Vretifemale_14630 [Volvox reticuliferus]